MTNPRRQIELPAEWRPERKLVAVAVVIILAYVIEVAAAVAIPELVEGAAAILVGYFIPNA